MFRDLGLRLEQVGLSKVRLEVVEWAKRAGFPEDRIRELAYMLETAPVKAKRSLSVFHRNGLLFFLNTRAILVGTRQQQPPVHKALAAARGTVKKWMESGAWAVWDSGKVFYPFTRANASDAKWLRNGGL